MFGVIRRSRPVIPCRLPESEDADQPQSEMKGSSGQPAPTDPAELPVAAAVVENINTPPLTPNSDTTGDGSADEPSVEEPTVEEVSEVESTVAEVIEVKAYEVEVSGEDTPDTEEGVSESDEERVIPKFKINHKVYRTWFMFWSIALAGGLLAYYVNTHQAMLAARIDEEPTEEMNLLLMPREKWDDSRHVVAKPSTYMAHRVIVVQTDTESCDTTITCTKLLNAMKRRQGHLNYNFLLATDGCIYEALGWQEPSPLYPDVRTMVVAFIGNYETLAPSTMQLSQLHSLLEASQELKYLTDSYTMLGRKQTVMPSKLFAYLAAFERWDKENSDTDEQYIDVDFEAFPIFDN